MYLEECDQLSQLSRSQYHQELTLLAEMSDQEYSESHSQLFLAGSIESHSIPSDTKREDRNWHTAGQYQQWVLPSYHFQSEM